MMEFRYRLNADDFTDYNGYMISGNQFKKRLQKQRIMSSLAVLGLGVVCLFFFKDKLYETMAVAIAAAAVLFFTFPSIAKGGMKSALLNMIRQDGDSLFREQLLQISEEGLHTESEDHGETITKNASPEELAGVSQFGQLYLIHFTNGNLLMVPVRAVEEGQKDKFFGLCGGKNE